MTSAELTSPITSKSFKTADAMAVPALSDASNRFTHYSARVRSNLAGFACLHFWPVERTERSQMLKLHCRCKLLHVKRKSMADRVDFCSRFLASFYK